MKNFLLSLVFGFIATAAYSVTMSKAGAPPGPNVGVGIAFSGPVGLSVYGELNETNFLQGAFSVGRSSFFAATADYGFRYPGALGGATLLAPYWGVGLATLVGDGNYWTRSNSTASATALGARIPLGMNFIIPQTPVQLGAEIVPTLLLTPVNYAFVQGGVNVRVLF